MRKPAVTEVALHPLLAERWSPRGFDPEHVVGDRQLAALLEAVRWAPSAANSQPWRIGVARRGTPAHAAVADALAAGNAAWAPTASLLLVVAAEVVAPDGAARPWAAYDAGQAVAHLTLQAQADGLAVHQMGGFDPQAVAAAFDLPPGVEPLTVVAVGRPDPEAVLPAPYAEREAAPRSRLPLVDLLLTPSAAALPLSA